MTINAYIDDYLAELLGQARSELLADLAAGISAMQRAAATLEHLRSNHLHDIELIEGRDGRDVASFLDDSVRFGRAAYAVVHMVIDKEKH
ncbi:hypothetical protein [Mycobacterium branderi]|uniref:Uncharacterized protein n=1 Tax=Mycobacterium branderi TaxID=43348 RepID=A0A7I7WE25_9MYCO|nr:hypothetical protein [Mycobacterium branderi]MCV7234563.1 hypothetical protein [Mycobacterium branderi]ORA28808.1 hypothetical protein BST20_28495 [Mycobacterium branderi]BBZ15350.1 hypothetical protein MBRA_55450 [Mycobacterium branderi]